MVLPTYWEGVATDEQIDEEQATQGNFGRYENEELFDLIEEFNTLPPEDDTAFKVAEDIQEILLKDMPGPSGCGIWLYMK